MSAGFKAGFGDRLLRGLDDQLFQRLAQPAKAGMPTADDVDVLHDPSSCCAPASRGTGLGDIRSFT